MSLTLHVNGDRWRAHLRATVERYPGLVPVAKGNGYGFGLGRLARRAQWLGLDTLAVGTYDELGEVASRFDGSLLVLTPWRPFGAATENDPSIASRVIHTVSRVEDVDGLLAQDPDARFVLEQRTSMLRHGMTARELRAAVSAWRAARRGRLEGSALHLPLASRSHLPEVDRLMTDAVAAGLATAQMPRVVYVSHLSDDELATLRRQWPDFELRPRIGTDLWLGDRGAMRATGTVLDVHRVERGEVYGYRGRTAPRAGQIVVVSGGTAHGIGLEAPTGDASLRSRAATLARGGLDAAGLVRSPYTIDGKQRLFAEPPHMQASMLFLPAGATVPAVGDEVDVRIRFTATDVDRVEID